ncbi:MAG: zinc ribbon domain-containing protein [Ignavibacteriales bacterium]|nr:zinc ribbon domain-containing protein [Ignavibacteriales bacterium]
MTHSYRICSNCNNVSLAKEEQRFCIWCGTRLAEECPQCSKPIIHSNGRFCYNCGARYDDVHRLSEGEGVRKSGAIGVESWAKEQTRRLEVKFPTNDFLTRRRP